LIDYLNESKTKEKKKSQFSTLDSNRQRSRKKRKTRLRSNAKQERNLRLGAADLAANPRGGSSGRARRPGLPRRVWRRLQAPLQGQAHRPQNPQK